MEEAFATMDVYLKKRWDLVPNLVSITKGYVSHERETLEAVIKARNVSVNSHNKDERIQGETALGLGLKNLFALAENYPDLKADKSFLNLQEQLASIENDILNSRKYYNAVVREFNTKIRLFPTSIIANMMKLEKSKYFDVDEAERKNVEISF